MSKLNLYYQSSIKEFLISDTDKIFGEITMNNSSSETRIQQSNTWKDQIRILKRELYDLDGTVIFEYSIPRMGKRVDNIVLYKNIVFVLEFKCGADSYNSNDYDQVFDYALDLKNFHKQSSDKLIVPILIATDADTYNNKYELSDNIMFPLRINEFQIGSTIKNIGNLYNEKSFSYEKWIDSEYLPTPTIVEAAQALYTGHNVEDITRNDAGAKNITTTTDCFVTGVPGAGKTLVGLNLGIQKADAASGEHAVFLSGNYPLVKVLQEALVRDRINNLQKLGIKTTKSDEHRKTNAFIQIIHKYRDSFVGNDDVPPEHIVIFDEAQRSWNHDKIKSFMKTKKGITDFKYSEPEFLISTMDRHKDWAVVVCLIGGGQEINDGEGGLPEWFSALRSRFSNWDIYVSDNLKDEYLIDKKWQDMISGLNVVENHDLHLSISLRSFRTPALADFVKATLDLDIENARILYDEIKDKYPIVITRDIKKAKLWVKEKSKGTQRYGLLATSGALRLKPEGIFVKNSIDVENWFLNDKDDVRSSYALEDVVTEFDVQGLEVDYSIVAWDADLRIKNNQWEYKRFRGSKWTNINKKEDRLYLKNSYRVLLTRARQGMVIFVPEGDEEDLTRKRDFYDGIYSFLKAIGICEI